VEAVMSSLGRYSVGFDAIQLDSACAANHLPIGGGVQAPGGRPE
jgi:hypothetical protein